MDIVTLTLKISSYVDVSKSKVFVLLVLLNFAIFLAHLAQLAPVDLFGI